MESVTQGLSPFYSSSGLQTPSDFGIHAARRVWGTHDEGLHNVTTRLFSMMSDYLEAICSFCMLYPLIGCQRSFCVFHLLSFNFWYRRSVYNHSEAFFFLYKAVVFILDGFSDLQAIKMEIQKSKNSLPTAAFLLSPLGRKLPLQLETFVPCMERRRYPQILEIGSRSSNVATLTCKHFWIRYLEGRMECASTSSLLYRHYVNRTSTFILS